MPLVEEKKVLVNILKLNSEVTKQNILQFTTKHPELKRCLMMHEFQMVGLYCN
jgi:hypothetical protein